MIGTQHRIRRRPVSLARRIERVAPARARAVDDIRGGRGEPRGRGLIEARADRKLRARGRSPRIQPFAASGEDCGEAATDRHDELASRDRLVERVGRLVRRDAVVRRAEVRQLRQVLMVDVDDGIVVIVVALPGAAEHRQRAAGLPGSIRRGQRVGGHRQAKGPARKRSIHPECRAPGETAAGDQGARDRRMNPVSREERASEVLGLERPVASARRLPDAAPGIRDVALLLVEHAGQPAMRLGRPCALGVRVLLIARLSSARRGNALGSTRQRADDADDDQSADCEPRAHERRLFARGRDTDAGLRVFVRAGRFADFRRRTGAFLRG